MKKETVKSIVVDLITDCVMLSSEDGAQVFAEYSPHVEQVHFRAYKYGYQKCNKTFFDIYLYVQGDLSPTTSEAKRMLKPLYEFINEHLKK